MWLTSRRVRIVVFDVPVVPHQPLAVVAQSIGSLERRPQALTIRPRGDEQLAVEVAFDVEPAVIEGQESQLLPVESGVERMETRFG